MAQDLSRLSLGQLQAKRALANAAEKLRIEQEIARRRAGTRRPSPH